MTTPHSITTAAGRLAGHLALPPRGTGVGRGPWPSVLLCHGFPAGNTAEGAEAVAYPELADRIANELGMVAGAFDFRGAGGSEGDFSLQGWLDDLLAAVDHLATRDDVNGGVWVVGAGTSGALAICAGAADGRVRGVAALGAPADFDDWSREPRRLLDHARQIGLIKDKRFPANFDAWARELRDIQAAVCARGLAPRPLLVMHGAADEVVPDYDARVIADAHGSADLRIFLGASHRLRHDPRAVAVLLGWLDRERHRRRAERN